MLLIAEKRNLRNRVFDSNFIEKEVKMKVIKLISLSIIINSVLLFCLVDYLGNHGYTAESLQTKFAMIIAPKQITKLVDENKKLEALNLELLSSNAKLVEENKVYKQKLISALIPEATASEAFTNHVKNPIIKTSMSLYKEVGNKFEELKEALRVKKVIAVKDSSTGKVLYHEER